MWAIIKKEFKSYYLSPIGYVVTGILLAIFGLFFYLTAIATSSVDLGGLYYYTAFYGIIITAPILTMRMFSEERKSGTEQLLLTSPVSISGIVFGKLIAALIVIFITLILTLIFFAIVSFFGTPSLPAVLFAMLGFLLMAMAALSIGMFASSITENQIIAGAITIAFLIVSLFLQSVGGIWRNLCLMSFYEKFPSGLVSINEIVGLVSFSAVFISLTIIVMQRRKSVK